MERSIMTELLAWKKRSDRKPLLLRGARQTGKTWLAEEFGRSEFDDVVKIDFMLDERARQLFEPDLDPHRIMREIELREGRSIDPVRSLLLFDEIQEVPRGITALKYFCERAREYHVLATGSYMGISLRREGEPFPVGKVDELTLRPLSFEEFLRALAGDPLADALADGDMAALQGVADVLEGHLKTYFVVGGMPECVEAFRQAGDLAEVRRLQLGILSAYDADFSKHVPTRLLERVRLAWQSLPAQLARENRKFVYGAVRPGARARDFEEAIQWICDYGAAGQVGRVSALRFPLAGYAEVGSFKLFGLDVGLLGAQAGLDPRIVLDGSQLFTEFKGALTEQYVAQELRAQGLASWYWSSSTGNAETDFAVEHGGAVLPIEAKAGESLRSKSLRVACDKFGLARAIRTSLSPYRDDGWLVNIPLWAICQLRRLASGSAAPAL